MITVFLLALGFIALDLVAVLIIGVLWAVRYIGPKLAPLALTLQGHRREALGGFHIADDYPPRP